MGKTDGWIRRAGWMRMLCVAGIALGVAACKGDGDEQPAAAADDPAAPHTLPEGAVGTEYVRFTLGEQLAPDALLLRLDALLGEEAPGTDGLLPYELGGGLVVSRAVGPNDDAGVGRLRYQIRDREGQLRDVAAVPVSLALGARFRALVRTALTRMDAYLEQPDAESDKPIQLELRAHGASGGHVALRVSGPKEALRLTHVVRGPHLLIGEENHGAPVASAKDWTSIAMTVGFRVRQDELNFFVDKAYGRGKAEGQSFDHFVLGAPHDWTNVTVTPWIGTVPAVRVAFEATLEDGSRLPFASAPASDDMGAQFIELVNAAMTAMQNSEAQSEGTAESFEIPYFYDDPEGGVVQVRVHGHDGVFDIFYDLETARTPNGQAPPVVAPPREAEEGTGDGEYGTGKLAVTFVASDLVLASNRLTSPLVGTVHAAIYRASDVEITGPVAGAQSLASVRVDEADLQGGARSIPILTDDLPAVPIMVLGFFDVNGNAVDGDEEPDAGDPVTVPLAEYQVLVGLTSEITVPFDLVY